MEDCNEEEEEEEEEGDDDESLGSYVMVESSTPQRTRTSNQSRGEVDPRDVKDEQGAGEKEDGNKESACIVFEALKSPDAEVVTQAFASFQPLGKNPTILSELTPESIVNAIVEALGRHTDNAKIHLSGMRALNYLAREGNKICAPSREKMSASTFTRCALRSLNLHSTNDLQVEALSVLTFLAPEVSTQTASAECVIRKVLQPIALKYRSMLSGGMLPEDAKVIHLACQSLYFLAQKSKQEATVNQIANAINLVKDLFWVKPEEASELVTNALTQGLQLLIELACKGSSYQQRISQNGIDGIARFQERHPDNAQVQQYCIVLYGNLACQKHHAQHLAIHHLDSIIKALKRHKGNRSIRHAALGAMRNLSQGTTKVLVLRHAELIATTLENILDDDGSPLHRKEDICTACQLLQQLSLGMERWHHHPATWNECLRVLLEALKRPDADEVMDKSKVLPIVLSVMAKSALAPTYRTFLIEQSAIDVIFASMSRNLEQKEVQMCGCDVLSNISINDQGEDLIVSLGGIDIIATALRFHADDPNVQISGFHALSNLATSSEVARQTMRRAGVVQLTKDALRLMSAEEGLPSSHNNESQQVTTLAKRVLRNLSASDE